MPFITVKMLEGRTLEQKKELAQAITDALVNIGNAKPENVYVIFEEMKKTELANAGQLYSDK